MNRKAILEEVISFQDDILLCYHQSSESRRGVYHLNYAITRAILKGYRQVVNATNLRSTLTMQDAHLQARHAKKKKDRTTMSLKWQSHGVKIN